MFKTLAANFTPSNDGAIVRLLVWLFGVSWKTSLSGFLSFFIATFGVITSGLAPLAALNPQSALAKYSAIISGVLTLLSGLGKAWVGLLMQDAGTVAVKLPKQDDPVPVSSHEIPDSTLPKNAKIVKE